MRKDSREIARNGGAMISSEVQRTLVKSPPELWAEISDPESLARHLGEFGEIRITRVQPEQKVEWEADAASGTVVIKPSGWGTKVKLTVTRELTEPEVVAEDAQPDDGPALESPSAQMADQPTLDGHTESVHVAGSKQQSEPKELQLDADPELTPPAELEDGEEPDAELEAVDDEEPDHGPQLAYEEPKAVAELQPEQRRGFFARLFARRRARSPEPAPDALAEPEPELRETDQSSEQPDTAEDDLGLETELAAKQELTNEHIEAADERNDEHPEVAAGHALGVDGESPGATNESVELDDASLKTELAEEIATEEVTAVLTGVLDRLGAAHHRPFSRA
jgi:uncharacterized protein YndB with AHSA1/START domain